MDTLDNLKADLLAAAEQAPDLAALEELRVRALGKKGSVTGLMKVIARATGATSMTDNSDGLVVDLGTIARRSGVGIDLFSSAVAPDDLLIRAAQLLDVDPWEWVLAGGEDHTLLATTAGDPPSGFRTIGRVTRNDQVTVDGVEPAYGYGWVSF